MKPAPNTPAVAQTRDLFGDTFERPCAFCGSPFDAPLHRGKGRRVIFCSDGCRDAQQQQQKQGWARQKAAQTRAARMGRRKV
jgi:alpha-D-ribose 1-methylphosphonate 5-phosphate C-P lyase